MHFPFLGGGGKRVKKFGKTIKWGRREGDWKREENEGRGRIREDGRKGREWKGRQGGKERRKGNGKIRE